MAILLGRAPLPRPKDLPRALRSLASHPTVNLTQAGFDGSADRIVRLVRQALGAGTAASSSTGSALEIPAQGYRPHFEIDQDGVIKFAAPAALDREGNNVDRLRRMHPTLRELSPGLVEALGRGNAPHSYLHERSKTYNDMTDRALEEIDFALLYMEGLRLANAEKAVSGDGRGWTACSSFTELLFWLPEMAWRHMRRNSAIGATSSRRPIIGRRLLISRIACRAGPKSWILRSRRPL